jgi:acyl-CoA dehydrogenase
VYFDQVAVASDQVVGEVGHGADYLFEGLNAERINVAALAVGLGRYVIRQAVAYANRRTVFGNKPIGSYQALQHPLAEAFTHIEAAWLLTLKAARAYDAQRSAAGWANLAKLAAVDAALQACDVAIEVHGGNGFTTDYDLLSVWSLCRLLKTAPVSRELVLNYIGVHVLGLPPSS